MEDTDNKDLQITKETISQETGEVTETKNDSKPRMLDKPFENEFDVAASIENAGTLEATQKQLDILFAPPNEEDIEIRPDGLIYLPWMEYATRLRNAFGISWTMIPQGMPKFHGNNVFWGFWLFIKGSYQGYALGEQAYIPSNHTMSYADAVEGAKSNALMKLCKNKGITIELWKPSFVRNWKERYAEQYTDPNSGRKKWRKKGTNGDDIDSTPNKKTQKNKQKDSTPQEKQKPQEKNRTDYILACKKQNEPTTKGFLGAYEVLGSTLAEQRKLLDAMPEEQWLNLVKDLEKEMAKKETDKTL